MTLRGIGPDVISFHGKSRVANLSSVPCLAIIDLIQSLDSGEAALTQWAGLGHEVES
jgi:hypothetical protein